MDTLGMWLQWMVWSRAHGLMFLPCACVKSLAGTPCPSLSCHQPDELGETLWQTFPFGFPAIPTLCHVVRVFMDHGWRQLITGPLMVAPAPSLLLTTGTPKVHLSGHVPHSSVWPFLSCLGYGVVHQSLCS
jgi:hypothetical protein